jgi:SAM-dependent methyltransferase
MNESLEARLRRLKEERDEADRRYNDALTAVDRAVPPYLGVPEPQGPLDERQLGRLNEAWNILPSPPAATGLGGRLTGLIWRTIAPYLERQLAFNSILVQHINGNMEAQRAAHTRALEATAAFRTHLDAVNAFHARLMVYFQQFTGYVDSKDRDTYSGALVLNAALSQLAETQAKYRESLEAREHRYEARTAALAAAHEELRGMIAIAQQAIVSLRRHLKGTHAEGADDHGASAGTPARGAEGAAASAFAPSLDAYKYVAFEDQFRGSQAVIRERQESYVPYFRGLTADVLDIGCGRGEFIELLNTHGIPARGIDLNHEMAEQCRARGLNVLEADAVSHLASLPDGSLGGIFAAQVVEHLEPSYLLRLLDLSFEKLQPGGILVLETLNPACWTAFFESYIRDITHRWPLHPDTLKYLVTASGFTRVDVEFRSPVAEQDRLQPIALAAAEGTMPADAVEAFNGNVEKLNARLFTYMDYAVVAGKPPTPGD